MLNFIQTYKKTSMAFRTLLLLAISLNLLATNEPIDQLDAEQSTLAPDEKIEQTIDQTPSLELGENIEAENATDQKQGGLSKKAKILAATGLATIALFVKTAICSNLKNNAITKLREHLEKEEKKTFKTEKGLRRIKAIEAIADSNLLKNCFIELNPKTRINTIDEGVNFDSLLFGKKYVLIILKKSGAIEKLGMLSPKSETIKEIQTKLMNDDELRDLEWIFTDEFTNPNIFTGTINTEGYALQTAKIITKTLLENSNGTNKVKVITYLKKESVIETDPAAIKGVDELLKAENILRVRYKNSANHEKELGIPIDVFLHEAKNLEKHMEEIMADLELNYVSEEISTKKAGAVSSCDIRRNPVVSFFYKMI